MTIKLDYAKYPFLAQIYTIGPLAQLQRTLPPNDIDRPFKAAVNPDGSILYTAAEGAEGFPGELDGYRRDAENPFLFHPLWKACGARSMGARVKTDGSIDVKMACNHPQAATDGKPVDYATCRGCIMRTQNPPPRPKHHLPILEREFKQPTIEAGGRLVYEKTGWEPPACPEGYNRDPTNMWAFIPKWLPCADRDFENTVKPCGCVTVNALCHSKASIQNGKKVSSTICQNCPVRREG